MDEQEIFKIMDAANRAHHDHEAQQNAQNKTVLEAVRTMVTTDVFAEIEAEIEGSGSTHDYEIVVQPAGHPQDNGFSLGDVYVDQSCGICGDDFYGTVALPLPDGRYLQFSFHC